MILCWIHINKYLFLERLFSPLPTYSQHPCVNLRLLQMALLRSESSNPSYTPISCNCLQSFSHLSGWLSPGWLSFKTFLWGAERQTCLRLCCLQPEVHHCRNNGPGYFCMWLVPTFSWQLWSTLTMQITFSSFLHLKLMIIASSEIFPAYFLPHLLEQVFQQADPVIFLADNHYVSLVYFCIVLSHQISFLHRETYHFKLCHIKGLEATKL